MNVMWHNSCDTANTFCVCIINDRQNRGTESITFYQLRLNSSGKHQLTTVYSYISKRHTVYLLYSQSHAHCYVHESVCYLTIRSIGRDTNFTVSALCVFLWVCMVTDFSAGALPIGVKFCTAVRPHHILLFWGIAPGMAELWASTGAIWWDMLLAEAIVTYLVNYLVS